LESAGTTNNALYQAQNIAVVPEMGLCGVRGWSYHRTLSAGIRCCSWRQHYLEGHSIRTPLERRALLMVREHLSLCRPVGLVMPRTLRRKAGARPASRSLTRLASADHETWTCILRSAWPPSLPCSHILHSSRKVESLPVWGPVRNMSMSVIDDPIRPKVLPAIWKPYKTQPGVG
jgi:hypothetical protein